MVEEQAGFCLSFIRNCDALLWSKKRLIVISNSAITFKLDMYMYGNENLVLIACVHVLYSSFNAYAEIARGTRSNL